MKFSMKKKRLRHRQRRLDNMSARQRKQNSFASIQEGTLSIFAEMFMPKTRGAFGRKK
jgi:hypothetical protein